jgi:DNA-binding transcriptional MerR regulator
MIATEIKKLYYNISEVAKKFDISESTLRHWEREFSQLKPKRTSAGDRKYTEKDLATIEKIIGLRREHTVEGAKKILQNKQSKNIENEIVIQKLQEVKAFLLQLKNSLGGS